MTNEAVVHCPTCKDNHTICINTGLTIIPVIALPATWPTALPTATPPAMTAICFIMPGCWGCAIADGGAAIGVEGGGGGGAALGAGAGGALAMGALGGGEAARPRRGIFTL